MAKRSRQRNSGGEGSIAAIKSYEDTIPDDGAERFLHNRDMISLTERDAPSDEEDYLTGQNEVLALNLPSGADEEDAYDQEDDIAPAPKKKERVKKAKPDVSTKGRYGKTSSDEESSGSGSGSGSDDSSDEEDAAWGRAYHARPSTRRGRQDEESDDEQREEEREMEEKEVKRLQRKMRESVKGDDWGLEDFTETEEADDFVAPASTSSKPSAPKPATTTPTPTLPSTTPAPILLTHLSSTDPVKLALARDFPLVVDRLRKTERGIKRMQEERKQSGEGELHEGLGWLHYQTLLTYTTTLAFYLHLASLPAASRPDFSTHPILPRLLQLKEGLAMLEDLDFDAASVNEEDMIELYDGEEESGEEGEGFEVGDDEEEEDDMTEEEFEALKKSMLGKMVDSKGGLMWDDGVKLGSDEDDDDEDAWVGDGTLEDGELDGLMADADGDELDSEDEEEDDFDDMDEDDLDLEDDEDEDLTAPIKKSSKKVSIAKAPKYALEEPVFKAKSKTSKKSGSSRSATAGLDDSDLDLSDDAGSDLEDDMNDLGDPTHLTSSDASDKQKKTRSLRFHTSRIAATSARREAGRRKAQGFGGSGGMEGDEDLPYRNRNQGRDDAIKKSTGRNAGAGEDLDMGGDGEEESSASGKQSKRSRDGDDEDGPEAYYESVKRQKRDEKTRSKEEYDDAVAADKNEREVEDTTSGPRSLTRAISKNRGLTPHRSKASRNPRVKQKLRYEKAKRKVGSQRAVYKGGEGAQTGAYKGEKSGISQGSKSRRF